jgi:hypothetical protein
VSPNSKAPGPPEVRLLLEGAKDKTRRRYREAKAMSQRDGRQKSECPHSTSAAGEPSRGSLRRGRRAPCHRPLEGNTVRSANLVSVSTRRQRIARLVKHGPSGFGAQRACVIQRRNEFFRATQENASGILVRSVSDSHRRHAGVPRRSRIRSVRFLRRFAHTHHDG